jgi:hypothetical protein
MLENEIRNVGEQERKIEKNEQTNPPINSSFQLFINGKKVKIRV